jgi:hypothetical protein
MREEAAAAHGITARDVGTVVVSIRGDIATRKRAPGGIATIVIGVGSASGRTAGIAIANAIQSAAHASAQSAPPSDVRSGMVRVDPSGTTMAHAMSQARLAATPQLSRRMSWATALRIAL